MKYYTLNKVLVDNQERLIKELACPAQKQWNELLNHRQQGSIPSRYCAGCDKSVFDISSLSESSVKAFVNDEQSPCLYIDFQRSDIELVNSYSAQDSIFKDYQDNPEMLAMHRQFMALNKPQQFCEQPAPPNLVRSTDQLSVMQEYLEKGYQLDLVACMPNSADSKAAYLRYDRDANTITEISSQDHFDPNTDVPLPAKAYLIPAGLKANSQVLLAPMIHPFGVDFFYGHISSQLDKTDLEFNQTSSSSTLPQTSLSSIPRLVEALWDDNAIQVKQLSSPVVYTARTASAIHWAEAQGYALQFVESSKHSSDDAISAAYILPKNINEGDRVFISDLIQQYPKEIIATANHQSTSYITQCEGIITQQGIELIIPEPVEILG
jgi:hypothetical protein